VRKGPIGLTTPHVCNGSGAPRRYGIAAQSARATPVRLGPPWPPVLQRCRDDVHGSADRVDIWQSAVVTWQDVGVLVAMIGVIGGFVLTSRAFGKAGVECIRVSRARPKRVRAVSERPGEHRRILPPWTEAEGRLWRPGSPQRDQPRHHRMLPQALTPANGRRRKDDGRRAGPAPLGPSASCTISGCASASMPDLPTTAPTQ
jgi:hypothetical protein